MSQPKNLQTTETKDKKMEKYTLTEEHGALIPAWRDRWIANAMSTKQMDEEERSKCREAAKELYRSANLNPPPDNRIVFVPSPFALRFASGFASWIWYMRKNTSKKTITNNSADKDSLSAIEVATFWATKEETKDDTDGTDVAKANATEKNIKEINKKNNNWYSFDVCSAASLAKKLGVGCPGLECARKCYSKMYQGGNQWSGWSSFITFFRYVAKLPVDYSKFNAFEYLSEHSGPRIMHEKFCMISDRPEVLLVDDNNRPHCDNGPFCKWRDGTSLFSIHGVRVPEFVVTHPEQITLKDIDEEKNAEVRRVMINRYKGGTIGYMKDAGAEAVASDKWGTIWIKKRPNDVPLVMLEVENSTPEPDGTFKHYWLRVSSKAYNGDTMKYPQAAAASTWRRKDEEKSLFFKDWHDYQPTAQS